MTMKDSDRVKVSRADLEAKFEALDKERRASYQMIDDRPKTRVLRGRGRIKGGLKRLKTELIRAKMGTGTLSDRVSEVSEALVALEIIRMTKWGPMTSKRLDQSKSDWLFMLDNAKLFVQVKGSTFGSGDDLRWTLKIFKHRKSLSMELFTRPNFYLAIVLFPCTSEIFHANVSLLMFGWKLLLVPGSGVIKYFEGDKTHKPKSKNTHNITITPDSLEKGTHEWWMGERPEDIKGIFKAKYEQQMGER